MSDIESGESQSYLQEGFDASTLTVPRLRSILVQYDIPYPSGAKKAELVDIFDEQLVPRSKKILKERARARRTSKGITNADRYDDNDELIPEAPKSTRKSSSRSRLNTAELETPSTRRTRSISPVKKTPRAGAKHPRVSEAETSVEPETIRRTVRKTRRTETPVVKVEDTDDDFPRRPENSRVFSDENPFQSGSSPAVAKSPEEKERRRRSNYDSPAKRRSSAHRRRTTEVKQAEADQGIKPPSRSTFSAEIPISSLQDLNDYDENGVEVGEEFTPDAEEEIRQQLATQPQSAIVRRPRKKQRTSKAPIWVVLLTMLGGYAAWYRQEKLAVGYCGVGRPATSIISTKVDMDKVPDWAVTLVEPQCEPCPQHAYCFENLETSCESDFVLQPHPLSLGGLVPLPPTCEPDGEKVRKVKVVADRAVEFLRQMRAKYECGEPAADGKPLKTPTINEEELKQKVGEKRRRGMSETEFEDLWGGAIGEIHGRDEVDVERVHDETTDTLQIRLSSRSLAHIPLACAIRRSFRLTLERYRLHALGLILVLLSSLYARFQYTSFLTTRAAIPNLVALTLDRLAAQAAKHAADPETWAEGYIPISQLRDDVLRDEHSLAKRDKIWQKVRKVVEMNANVRAAQRQDRNGEIARVWEWIGAVGEIEDTPGRQILKSARRRSGRPSMALEDERSESPVKKEEDLPVGISKWQERPIY